MICSFCGADNRPENKFCGMCGVRLEQRKAERRLRQDPASMKCLSCGHINEPGYKFCGMCGTRIERRLGDRRGSGVEFSRVSAAANARASAPEGGTQRRSDRPPSGFRATEVLPEPETAVFHHERPQHGIQGPSFLGLNDEPESDGGYLLEDEGTSRRGLRTLVLLAILAAIVGLIVVQWRSGFRFGPSVPETPKTEPARQPQGAAPDPASAASDPDGQKTGVTSPAAVEQGFSDDGKKILDQAFGSKAEQGTTTATGEPGNSDKQDTAAPGEPASSAENGIAAGNQQASVSATQRPSPGIAAAPDRAPSDAPRKPSNLLVKAQQYLQGTGGVRQNCEQGLIYLRAAAQENDPEAAVQMGALYSSGHCVQRDPVMAWRWFSSAQQLEPGNRLIKANMDQLWVGMTEKERQQASR